MGLVRQLFGKSTAPASAATVPTSEPTPGSTQAPTSEPTPRSTPAPTSASESSEAPVYVVHDPGGSGIIVDLSLQSVGMLPEHPAWHAAELLDRLMHDAEFAGKLASEKALKKFYAVICHDDGIRPLPWTISPFQRRPQGDPWAGLQEGL